MVLLRYRKTATKITIKMTSVMIIRTTTTIDTIRAVFLSKLWDVGIEEAVSFKKHSGVALTRLPILMQAESMRISNSFKLIL